MEIYNVKEDIKVFCTTAASFPDGIQEAFIKLEKMLSKEGRTFYGISYKNEDDIIIYKAAVSENFKGEAENYGFETSVIPKGTYLTETIIDWRKKMETFETTFFKLLADPRLDKNFPCVEWYKNDYEVMCMIKIKNA